MTWMHFAIFPLIEWQQAQKDRYLVSHPGQENSESRGYPRETKELLLNESRLLFELMEILDLHTDGGTLW